MTDDELTHVQITKGTRRRLRVWKAERDLTYDEAVNQLIERADNGDGAGSE